MKKQIVDALERMSFLLMFLFVLSGALAGLTKGIGFMLMGVVVAFFVAVPIFGMLFLFLEMNENLRGAKEDLAIIRTLTSDLRKKEVGND